MTNWRITQQNWKADLLITEFFWENLSIFQSDITQKNIDNAIKILRQNNALNRAETDYFSTEYIEWSTSMIIKRSCYYCDVIDSVSLNFSQVSETLSQSKTFRSKSSKTKKTSSKKTFISL